MMNRPLRNSRLKLTQGQLFWREVGHGPTIIFLHGSWQDSGQWLSVIERLSDQYHCLAPDLLGFGTSEKPRLHYSIDLEVTSLVEFLETLQLRQIYLVGHSVGAWIATRYALKYPDRVQGLILLEPEGVQPESHMSRWSWSRWLMGTPPILGWLLQAVYPLAKLMGRQTGIKRSLELRQKMSRSQAACQLLFQRRWPEIKAEFVQGQLPSLNMPVLVLVGDRDQNTQPIGTLIQRQVSQGTVQVIPYAGIDLPEGVPEAVAQAIQSFVPSPLTSASKQ
ncbi:MAG: alpha/beta hydrolase [Leptolyngbyaceae cyanobacterium bins.59]|nr:alpha/beta hydrolase [Leptolyngbyaceae cyanobacterium bins.59]